MGFNGAGKLSDEHPGIFDMGVPLGRTWWQFLNVVSWIIGEFENEVYIPLLRQAFLPQVSESEIHLHPQWYQSPLSTYNLGQIEYLVIHSNQISS